MSKRMPGLTRKVMTGCCSRKAVAARSTFRESPMCSGCRLCWYPSHTFKKPIHLNRKHPCRASLMVQYTWQRAAQICPRKMVSLTCIDLQALELQTPLLISNGGDSQSLKRSQEGAMQSLSQQRPSPQHRHPNCESWKGHARRRSG